MPGRGVLLVAFALLTACQASATDISVAQGTAVEVLEPSERRPAPILAGPTVRGEPIEAGDLRGKVVVVNFWGTWCGPCRAEQPLLEAAWKRYRGGDVLFIGVNTRGDQEAAARAFLEEFDVTYPSLYDPTSAVAFEFGVRAMPATFVLDRDGLIAAEVIGAVRTRAEIDGLVDAVLAA